MGRYTALKNLPYDFLKVGKFSIDTIGGAEDGGKNGIGTSISRDLSSGGDVAVTLANCYIQAPEEHRVINWLAAMLNTGSRFINVPVLTDWTGPFPTLDRFPAPFVTGIPHSDGSMFSDGSGYSQATVWGKVTENAALHAGLIRMRVYGADRRLDWSEWFSIYHNQNGDQSRGWRAYRFWEIYAEHDDGVEVIEGEDVAYQEYTLAITPALREATVSGTRVEFARPRFAAKFPVGFTLKWEVSGFWRANPTIEFVEAW